MGVYSSDSRLVDLTLKCLWRVIKKLPSWEKELDYEPILYESSIFFKDYPSHTWKKDNNIPIRTIKTIIYTIVKMKSVSVIMYFISVPNFRETELYSYTLKVLDVSLTFFKSLNQLQNIQTRISRFKSGEVPPLPF